MKNSEYWQKRFERLEVMLHSKGVEYYNNLSMQYEKASRGIQKEIESWYLRFAKDEGISLSDAKRMLDRNELREFRMGIEEYIEKGRTLNYSDEWRRELKRASTRWHVSRLEYLKLQMQQYIETLYGNESDGVEDLLRNVFHEGYYHTAYEIQKGVGLAWSLTGIDERRVEKILAKPWSPDGTNFSKRIWGKHRPELVQYLNTELTQTIIRGEAPQNLINNIAKKFDVSRNNAANLVMTESAYFASVAQEECYKDLDVERYEIVATFDFKTSKICRGMDGKVFKMSDYEAGVTAPPFHNRCRTVTAPYFDDEFTTENVRAARGEDGKVYHVPANIKYNEWKEQYVD